ncbi:MAG: ATP synthase F0 subunit B [Deltaproteobacteria bacterium]|nr:ATP synthase F0 subunit B [Deltaproteobacteria bacterium]
MLSLDWTFAFQILLFLILWAFLRRFLFEPHFDVMEQREHRSEGAMRQAQQVKAEVGEMEEQYKSRLTATRSGAIQQVETVAREAEGQAQAITDAARTEADKILEELRATLRQEIENARKELQSRAPEFARNISEKLLGRALT